MQTWPPVDGSESTAAWMLAKSAVATVPTVTVQQLQHSSSSVSGGNK